jgi:hypothetical protein
MDANVMFQCAMASTIHHLGAFFHRSLFVSLKIPLEPLHILETHLLSLIQECLHVFGLGQKLVSSVYHELITSLQEDEK